MNESKLLSSINNERGSMLVAISSVVLCMLIIYALLTLSNNVFKTATDRVLNDQLQLSVESAAEAGLYALRLAEMNYIRISSTCATTVAPFLEAINRGHQCPGLGAISLFSTADASALGITVPSTFSYLQSTPCQITQSTGLTCGGQALPLALFDIGNVVAEQAINKYKIRAIMQSSSPGRGAAEFQFEIAPPEGSVHLSRRVTIRTALINQAHNEPDGRVTQSIPDVLSPCPGRPWSELLLYDAADEVCKTFSQLGGGTGLAYYAGSYFGFRPGDGMVIDMMSAASTSSSSYIVEQNGTLNGITVFPPHSREALQNVDDITAISKQIYYIAGGGDSAHIGVIGEAVSYSPSPVTSPPTSAPSYHRIPLCPLGAIGWGNTFAGIAASGASDVLLPPAGDNRSRLATFALKTDNGDLITALIAVTPGGSASANCRNFTAQGRSFRSCCYVAKDRNIQQIEFSRTNGFDRADPIKPYFIY